MTFNADRILKPKYDVIVIGAGPGGLTAASLLAKRGVDVLVVEQQGIPGARAKQWLRSTSQ